MNGYGYVVIIKSEDFETRYGHLDSTSVSQGQRVASGQLLGKSGKTGRVTGPHLHFELRHGGIVLNPMNYLAM